MKQLVIYIWSLLGSSSGRRCPLSPIHLPPARTDKRSPFSASRLAASAPRYLAFIHLLAILLKEHGLGVDYTEPRVTAARGYIAGAGVPGTSRVPCARPSSGSGLLFGRMEEEEEEGGGSSACLALHPHLLLLLYLGNVYPSERL